MATHVAETLGLLPIGTMKTFGVHGEQENERFYARFSAHFAQDVSMSKGASIVIEREFIGVPGMETVLSHAGIVVDGEPLVIVGLLGRDFLRHTTLTYRGADGRVTLDLVPSSFPNTTLPSTPPGPGSPINS
jgi:hypothetical protein